MALTVNLMLDSPPVATLVADRDLACNSDKSMLVDPLSTDASWYIASKGREIEREWVDALGLTSTSKGRVVQKSEQKAAAPGENKAAKGGRNKASKSAA